MMDPHTMEGALQSAMKVRQAQLDRDRAQFLACTRPMQNSLFHGLYGGGEGGGVAAPPAAVSVPTAAEGNAKEEEEEGAELCCSSDSANTMQNSLSLLSADLSEVRDLLNSELQRRGVDTAAAASPLAAATVTGGGPSSFSSGGKAGGDEERGGEEGADDLLLESSSHPLQHRLKVLMCVHSLEKRLRKRNSNSSNNNSSKGVDSASGEGISEEEVRSNDNNSATTDYLRLLFLRTVASTAAAFVRNSASASAASIAPSPSATLRGGAAAEGGCADSADHPGSDLSFAIDLLESGYAALGYLTPQQQQSENMKMQKTPLKTEAAAEKGEGNAEDEVAVAPLLPQRETAMERALDEAEKTKTNSSKKEVNSSSAEAPPVPKEGSMEAIKDDAVAFFPLQRGVAALFATTPSPSSSDSSSSSVVSAAELAAHAVLVALGSTVSKEALDLSVARTLLGAPAGGDEGMSTDIKDVAETATDRSPSERRKKSKDKSGPSQRLLLAFSQVGALSDLCCNLSICYNKEGNAAGLRRRDTEGEEVLSELLRIVSPSSLTASAAGSNAAVESSPPLLSAPPAPSAANAADCSQFAKDVAGHLVAALTLGSSSSLSASESTSTSVASAAAAAAASVSVSPFHLRSVYLLAKSVGCSISSSTDDARRALKLLEEHAIRPWGFLLQQQGGVDSFMELVLGAIIRNSEEVEENEEEHAKKTEAATAAASAADDDAGTKKESSSSSSLSPSPPLSLLVPRLSRTLQQCAAQLADCVALRDSLAAEVSKAEGAMRRGMMTTIGGSRKATTTASASTSAPEAEVPKNNNSINNTSTDNGGAKAVPSVAAEEDVPLPLVPSSPLAQHEAAPSSSSPPSQSSASDAATRRREEIEFTLRQEVQRARKDLVTLVYQFLFQPNTAQRAADFGKEEENGKNAPHGDEKDGDYAAADRDESERRILRYQSFSEQPLSHRRQYAKVIDRFLRARESLLDFLARRLFSGAMLPTRCFRVCPFAIADPSMSSASLGASSFSSHRFALPANTLPSSADLRQQLVFPPPSTREEYAAWVALFIKAAEARASKIATPSDSRMVGEEVEEKEGGKATAMEEEKNAFDRYIGPKKLPQANERKKDDSSNDADDNDADTSEEEAAYRQLLTEGLFFTPNLARILRSSAAIGLNVVGPYGPGEGGPEGGMAFQHYSPQFTADFASSLSLSRGGDAAAADDDGAEYAAFAEFLFADAVASISNPNLFRLREQEFLWESWEVRRKLRQIVFNFQFPTESLEARTAALQSAADNGGLSSRSADEGSTLAAQYLPNSRNSNNTSNTKKQSGGNSWFRLPHRFYRMASGQQHSAAEMVAAQHFFALSYAEGHQRGVRTAHEVCELRGEKDGDSVSPSSPSATAAGGGSGGNASASASAAASYSRHVLSALVTPFASLCVTAHDYLHKFLGSEAHNERVAAAMADARARRQQIAAASSASQQ